MSIVTVALACLLISSIWNFLFWDSTYGLSMPIFAAVVVFFLLWYKKTHLSKNKTTLSLNLLLIAYLSLCVCVYRNSIILYAAIPTIYFALGALAFIDKNGYSFSNSIGVTETLVKKIGAAVVAAPDAISRAFNMLLGAEKASRTAIKVVIGIVISVPFMIVFAWLFVSADPVFENFLKDFFDLIWRPELFKRGVVIIFMWFFLCGYFAAVSNGFALKSHLAKSKPRQNFDGVIIFIFLLMNNLLFLSFIMIQLKYLFGGIEVIRDTDLTYAEYAHRGFYEFWAMVILVSAIVVYTTHRLKEQTGRIRRFVEYTWIAMICQTLVIIASGLKRIIVYEEAYGYTYLRILVGLFLLWMAGVFVLFMIKIIRAKSITWLVSGALSLAFVFLIFVSTFSLDRFIAQKNIDRYFEHGKEIDLTYLSHLSTDAYPEIKRLALKTENGHIRRSAENILRQMRREAKKNLRHWPAWNLSLTKASNDICGLENRNSILYHEDRRSEISDP